MIKLIVGEGSCGISAGAAKVYDSLAKELEAEESIELGITGCIGMCFLEPIVDVYKDGELAARLVHVKPEQGADIVKAVKEDDLDSLKDLMIKDEDKVYLEQQTRIALRHCGLIDPTSIDEYLAADGFQALKKILLGDGMTPEEVIEEVKISGLRGRGGAGFPTWFKWDACHKQPNEHKHLICNADEGDPGAFMDRAVIESDPFSLIEGMLIAAYAMGTEDAFVYVRAEYPLAIKRLTNALKIAEERGYLGDNILGTDFSCHIKIKAGAGAFVCGEETALIASLEGQRGMPKLKPPFPAQKGYNQEPSNINNVETYANVAWIINNGGAAFAAMGTADSKGTKVFALSGKIKRGGLVEITMGKTLREVIFDIGGGVRNNREFKAVQLGGPSGGCIPASLIDTKIEYKALQATGAIMGSGGMVVMDDSTCMVGMAKFFLNFTSNESCGKCFPCRLGTKRMLELLTRITEGKGKEGDVELLEDLCRMVGSTALCGLGQTAPNPVLTTIQYFRDEYDAHIRDKKCPAKECQKLLTYSIDKDKCVGCTLCARNCPVKAITGEVKKPHEINPAVCIRCGKCYSNCRFGAINVE